MRPNVFSFPPSSSFLDELAVRALKGELVKLPDHALALGELTIYLPNRRLCRALTKVFIENHGVTLLPRILPMGEDDLFEEQEPLLKELPSLERILILARLIKLWGDKTLRPTTLLESIRLAEELANLLDRFITEDLPQDALKSLEIAHDHSAYWELSFEFLKIIIENYPFVGGKIDASLRRNLILKAETARIALSDKPFIAAGSTGSIKATREFLKAVAQAKNGAVILPGLDTYLSRDDFAAIADDPGHPQTGLKRLIEAIGVERVDGVDYPVSPKNKSREQLISRALTPASRTHLWAERFDIDETALQNLHLIEAPDERSEALALALFIREKLEKPCDIVVITPDRGLARRLMAELSRWNIAVDDTAGVPLSETPLALYLRLLLATHDFDPLTLMSFMAHPLSPWASEEKLLSTIDLVGLRGTKPADFNEIKTKLKNHPECFVLLDEVETIIKPPEDITLTGWVNYLDYQLNFLNHLELEEKEPLLTFLKTLISDEASSLTVAPHEIEPLLARFMAKETIREAYLDKLPVRIMGLPEARAIDADFVILAGLNEGVFPPQTETDPWLSRAMCQRLGLEPPERRIALAAHDFVQALGIENCVLSRSQKKEGNPTVASRWLQRIKAVVSPLQWLDLQQKGRSYVEYAAQLDRKGTFTPAPRPEPKPPLSARPDKLSVTEIEKLVRDPYAIYAKRILRLERHDRYNVTPGGRDRGTLIHDIFKTYAKKRNEGSLENPFETLMSIGDEAFIPYLKEPMIATFWVPRFHKLAASFIPFDEGIRAETVKNHSEVGGNMTLNLLSGRQFTLTTIADRLDMAADGLLIFDYKTGAVPSAKQVKEFFASQLPLTALIAKSGGFKDVPANLHVKSFAYIKVTGAEEEISPKMMDDAESLTAETKVNLLELLNKFENEETAYSSKFNPFKQGDFGDYDHLARVDEWQSGEDE